MENDQQSRAAKMRSQITQHLCDAKKDIWKVQQYNFKTFREQPLAEISGSVGDIGTLLPIMIALTEVKSISLSSTLVFSGLANIFTGVVYGVPLPVQPMKAIAAVAIVRKFSPAETASAGLFVAAAIGFLSITGLIQWFTRKIPIPVIKGIQMGTGLSLVMSAGKLYFPRVENHVILAIAFLGLLASVRFARVPYALILLFIGVAFSIVADWISSRLFSDYGGTQWRPGFDIWHPRSVVPSRRNFATGTFEAGIGQLPLTTLNSVIAVSFLAGDLLPNIPTPSTTSLGISVMAINLVSCWFGSMPVCHGSGGLAAQYRFGARSGASIIFLGLIKLLLGLFAGPIALAIFQSFPSTFLCVLMIAAGLELATVGESLNTAGARDLDPTHTDHGREGPLDHLANAKSHGLTDEVAKRRWTIMLMTVAGILAFRNDAIGFLAGMLCHWSFVVLDKWDAHIPRGEGRIRLQDADGSNFQQVVP